MIFLGDFNIESIYVGTIQCKEVFLGPVRIWRDPNIQDEPSSSSQYTINTIEDEK